MSLVDTLGNEDWLQKNENKIKEILPETWTDIRNLCPVTIGNRLKALGIEWHSDDEFGEMMVFFEKTGIMLRNGSLLRRSTHSIFK